MLHWTLWDTTDHGAPFRALSTRSTGACAVVRGGAVLLAERPGAALREQPAPPRATAVLLARDGALVSASGTQLSTLGTDARARPVTTRLGAPVLALLDLPAATLALGATTYLRRTHGQARWTTHKLAGGAQLLAAAADAGQVLAAVTRRGQPVLLATTDGQHWRDLADLPAPCEHLACDGDLVLAATHDAVLRLDDDTFKPLDVRPIEYGIRALWAGRDRVVVAGMGRYDDPTLAVSRDRGDDFADAVSPDLGDDGEVPTHFSLADGKLVAISPRVLATAPLR